MTSLDVRFCWVLLVDRKLIETKEMKTLDQVKALERVLATMRQMISAGNWIAAKRINEQLVTLFMDGVLSEDPDTLARMRDLFAAFRSEMSTNDKETSPRSAVEAFLDANVVFATIAARRCPQGRAIAVNAEVGGARRRVLELLQDKKFMVTRELAEATGVRPETMSRLLTALKLEGLVTSRKAGRKVLSRLTLRGQKVLGGGSSHRLTIRVDISKELVVHELPVFFMDSQIKNPQGRQFHFGDLMIPNKYKVFNTNTAVNDVYIDQFLLNKMENSGTKNVFQSYLSVFR